MNKKSVILFFSVLVLLSLSVLYVLGDLSSLTLTKTGDGYNVVDWIGEYPVTINLTATANAAENDEGIVNITFTLDTANFSWGFVAQDGRYEVCEDADNVNCSWTNVTYAADGSAWTQWNCTNATSVITCESLDPLTTNLTSGYTNNASLIVLINVTTIGSTREELYVNFTAATNSSDNNNISSNTLGIDSLRPRLVEVNISDGNTTYANATWGTPYIIYNGGITIRALIEDSQLEGRIILAYNCNTTNVTEGYFTAGGSAIEDVLSVTNADAVGTLNHRGSIISSGTDCSSLNLAGANESLMFAFKANDTFNHEVILNGTFTADIDFNITLDDGEFLPTITKVNVTQTAIGLQDGTSTSKTLTDTSSGLDGTSDYLAANTVTFEIEVTGDKPSNVMIVWNDTGVGTTSFGPAVIGGTGEVFPNKVSLDETAALNATNITEGTGEGSDISINTTAAVYRTTLNLVGNTSSEFAFWVYANNTGDNYTRINGPYRFHVDGSGPSMDITAPEDTTKTPRGAITYTCKASESSGSGATQIMWYLKKPSETVFTKMQNYENIDTNSKDTKEFKDDNTNLAGDYDVKCVGVDAVGNERESSISTFSISYSTAEGVAAEGAGAAADIDLSTQEEVTITEKQGVISTFTLDGTTVHTLKIKSVDEVAGTVTIIIESDPIEITLKVGEMKEVDVDADGANDISVTLNKITDGTADITTKRLTPLPEKAPTEEVPPTEKPAEEITPTEAPSRTWLWILIIVIIVVIGVGYWFMKRK